MSLDDPLLHRPVSIFLLLLLSLVVDILECTVYVLVYLRILTSADVIPMSRREHMMHVVFESLFAYRAEQVVGSGSRLLDHRRVLFLRCFLTIQVFQIFVVLIFEVVEVLLRVLSFVG